MVIVTDEEWDIRNLRSSESLNKSISDEADLEEDVRRVSTAVQGSGRLDRQSRVLGTYDSWITHSYDVIIQIPTH